MRNSKKKALKNKVLEILILNTDENNITEMSQHKIARELNISRVKVRILIEELISDGLITKNIKWGRTTCYDLTKTFIWFSENGIDAEVD